MWILLAGIATLLLGAVGTYIILVTTTPRINTQFDTPASPVSSHATDGQRIRIAAMGDMLAHDTIIQNAKTDTGYDFARYFAAIRPYYGAADIVFCNQEGLSSGEAYGITGYPSFNAPTQFAADLQKGAGCNMINLANNHMGDKGVEATNATIDYWRNLNPLMLSGANKDTKEQETVSYCDVKGIRIGFVSFTDFNNNTETPGYSVNNYHDEALVRRLVSEARTNADAVIVSMHWGVEDSPNVSDDQKRAATLLASLGVDVIIGTGPHVLQKQDVIPRTDGGTTTVWYSLGNMLSSQFEINELIGGVAQFDIVMDDDRRVMVENLLFDPTYMHYEWTAGEKARDDVMARRNVSIYPLRDAAAPLSRSLFTTTIHAQRQYVIDTLGEGVTVR